MTAPLLVVPAPPQRGMQIVRRPRARVLRFDDGYAQASAPVNPIAIDVRVSWRLLAADAATLLAFLDARAGAETFRWQMPHEAQPRLWRCAETSERHDTDIYRVVSASLTEEVA